MAVVNQAARPGRPIVFTISVLIAVTTSTMVAVPSGGQDQDPVRADAFCPPEARSWDVLILMDESQSLRTNDPDGQRIAAAKRYVASLERSVEAGLRVRLGLATFGTDFELRREFTDLKASGNDDVVSTIERFGDHDLNTDYVSALYGLLDLDWSADCHRVVWLTDGLHDLSDAHRGDRTPRPYDGLERPLTSRRIGNDVADLLIPAVCGDESRESTVAPGYENLSGRLAQLGARIDIRLFYVGDPPSGDTKTLLEMMEQGRCGDHIALQTTTQPEFKFVEPPPPPTTTTPTTTTLPTTTTTVATTTTMPPSRACEDLSGPWLTVASHDGILWDGRLPDGIAPAFVRSAVVVAEGDSPELSTNHPAHRLEDGDRARRIVLDYSEVPYTSTEVHGEGVEEVCGSVVLEVPTLSIRIETSPIFPDTPIDFSLLTGAAQLAEVDEPFLDFVLDGVLITPPRIGSGRFRSPPLAVGDHTFEVRLVSEHSDPATASVTFTVVDLPDGPILRVTEPALGSIEATEFAIPIVIEADGREGEIRLLPVDPILGTDGIPVGIELSFPDGATAWSSGDPEPVELHVRLDRSVQTPDDHILLFAYVTDPADPAGLTRQVPLAVSVSFDHPRNVAVETILIAAMLALLLALIWGWLYGINRVAGRIRRPRRTRYTTFRVADGWTLVSDLSEAQLRRARHSPSTLQAGDLRAVRKTPWRPWRPPYVRLSLAGRRFVGVVGSGRDATNVSDRSPDLRSERRLHEPIVLIDVSGPAPHHGVVIAPVDPSTPTEDQFAGYVRDALASIPAPEETAPDE